MTWVILGIYYITSRLILIADDVLIRETDPRMTHDSNPGPAIFWYIMPVSGEVWLFITFIMWVAALFSFPISYLQAKKRNLKIKAQIKIKLQETQEQELRNQEYLLDLELERMKRDNHGLQHRIKNIQSY